MSPLILIRKIVSPLLFLNSLSRVKKRSSLMKIKAAKAYVIGVKKLRIFILGMLLVMFSLVLLGAGLLSVHVAIFHYSSWSFQAKFTAALLIGAVEFLGAVVILLYIFREESWVKFYGVQNVLNAVLESESTQKKKRGPDNEI